MVSISRTTTVKEDLVKARAELVQAKHRLHHAVTVDEKIECRIEIGRCTQRIRRLERELAGGY